MRALSTTAIVQSDGTLTARLPSDVTPGEHRVVIVLNEDRVLPVGAWIDMFPVDDVGPWPEGLSLHRADLYGDDGR